MLVDKLKLNKKSKTKIISEGYLVMFLNLIILKILIVIKSYLMKTSLSLFDIYL